MSANTSVHKSWLHRLFFAAFLLASSLLLAMNVSAQAQKMPSATDQRHSSQAAPVRDKITPRQAAAQATQRFPGKVLGIKSNNGVYRVKILHQGQVRVVTVNAYQ